MPKWAASEPRERSSPRMKDFEAAKGAAPASGVSVTMDPMLTMCPLPRSTMEG